MTHPTDVQVDNLPEAVPGQQFELSDSWRYAGSLIYDSAVDQQPVSTETLAAGAALSQHLDVDGLGDSRTLTDQSFRQEVLDECATRIASFLKQKFQSAAEDPDL